MKLWESYTADLEREMCPRAGQGKLPRIVTAGLGAIACTLFHIMILPFNILFRVFIDFPLWIGKHFSASSSLCYWVGCSYKNWTFDESSTWPCSRCKAIYTGGIKPTKRVEGK